VGNWRGKSNFDATTIAHPARMTNGAMLSQVPTTTRQRNTSVPINDQYAREHPICTGADRQISATSGTRTKTKTTRGSQHRLSGTGSMSARSGYDDEGNRPCRTWTQATNNTSTSLEFGLRRPIEQVTERQHPVPHARPTHELLTAAGQTIHAHAGQPNDSCLRFYRPGSDALSR